MRWSYLANLAPAGKFEWDQHGPCNIPASGYILPDMEDTRIYLAIRDHAQKGRYEGAQVDWGAFAIKVNGPELIEVLEESLGNTEGHHTDTLIGQYASYAHSLGANRYVAFLSVEI